MEDRKNKKRQQKIQLRGVAKQRKLASIAYPFETRPLRFDEPSTTTHQAKTDLGQLHD